MQWLLDYRSYHPVAVSSAGCDQYCHSRRQGFVAVLSNHSRGCKLKILSPHFSGFHSSEEQGWNITIKLKGGTWLLWEARSQSISVVFAWICSSSCWFPKIILDVVDASKKWLANGIWDREVAQTWRSVLNFDENCTCYRKGWLRGMA